LSTTLAIIVAVVCVIALGAILAVLIPRWRAQAKVEAQERLLKQVAAARFPVKLGDTVRIAGGEFRLRGAWVLEEDDAVIAAVWHAPPKRLFTLGTPEPGFFQTSEFDLDLPKSAPALVEIEDVAHARYQQRHVKVSPLGDAKPPPWARAELVEYRTAERKAFFALTDGTTTQAFRTERAPFERVKKNGKPN
jgi:hypothetical protein